MEVRKMKVGNLSRGYEFVNESGWTRSGFYHKSTLMKVLDGKYSYEMNSRKINYLNRTWERYTFETSMKSCVRDLIEKKMNEFIDLCKEKYNIKRLSKEKRNQAIEKFNELSEIKELNAILEELEVA